MRQKIYKLSLIGLLFLFLALPIGKHVFSNEPLRVVIGYQEDTWQTSEAFEAEWFTRERIISFVVDFREDYQRVIDAGGSIDPRKQPFELGEITFNGEDYKRNVSIRPLLATFDGRYEVQVRIPRGGKDEGTLNVQLNIAEGNEYDIAPQSMPPFFIKRDGTAPKITVTDIKGQVYQDDVKVLVSVEESNFHNEGMTVEVERNGQKLQLHPQFQLVEGTYQYEHLFQEEGDYRLHVSGRDKAGNEGASYDGTFSIEKTSPFLQIGDVSHDTFTKERNHHIHIRSAIAIDGIADVKATRNGQAFEIDAATFQSIDCGRQWQLEKTFLDGTYRFEASIRRKTGETVALAPYQIHVDGTKPTLTITGVTDNMYASEDVTITANVSDDNLVANESWLRLSKDGEEILHEPLTEQVSTHVLSERGVYVVEAQGVDRAGNRVTDKRTFTIDQDAPLITLDEGDVNNPAFYPEKKIAIQVEDYRLDSVQLLVTKEKAPYLVSPLEEKGVNEKGHTVLSGNYTFAEDGDYELTLLVRDKSGLEAKETLSFAIDKTPPVLKITGTQQGAFLQENTITAHVTERYFERNQVVLDVTQNTSVDYLPEKTVPYDKFVWEKEDNNAIKSKKSHQFTEDGYYEMTFHAKDGMGYETRDFSLENGETVEKLSFIVDQTAPVLSIENITDGEYVNGNRDVILRVQEHNYETNDVNVTVTKDNQPYEIAEWKNSSENTTLMHNFTEEGTYTISLQATDKAGNVAKTQRKTFTIDKTFPALKITGVKDEHHYRETPVMKVEAFDAHFVMEELLLQVKKDGQPYEIGRLTGDGQHLALEHSFTEEGTYDVTFQGKDKAGNETFHAPIRFVVDKTLPAIEITGIKEGFYYREDVSMKVQIVDKHGVKEKTFVRITRDGKEISNDNFLNTEKTYSFTERGRYVVSVEGEDYAGNRSTSQATFTIDKIPPRIIIDEGAIKKPPHYQEKMIEITLEDFTLDGSTLYVTRENEVYPLPPLEYKGIDKDGNRILSGTYLFKEEGEYILSLHAIDKAGNETAKILSFTIDRTAPRLRLSGIEDGDILRGHPILTAQVIEHYYQSNQVSLRVLRNTSVDYLPEKEMDYPNFVWHEEDNQGLFSMKEHQFTKDGYYEVRLKATDAAGNHQDTFIVDNDGEEKTMNKIGFIVDNVAPVLSIENVKDGSYYPKNCEVTLRVKEHNYKTNTVKVTVTKNGQPYSMGVWKNSSHDATLSHEFTQDGEYTITIEATDKAGNVAKTQQKTFTIDKTFPTLEIEGVEDGQHYPHNRQVNVRGYDVNFVKEDIHFHVTKDGRTYDVGQLTGNNQEVKLSFLFKEEGRYEISFRGIDKAGNETVHPPLRFVIDKTAPILKIEGVSLDSYHATSKVVTASVQELHYQTNDVTLTVTKDGKAYSMGTWENTGTLSKVAHRFHEDGDYVITLSARDKAGNEALMAKMVFTIDQTKPEIVITGIEDNQYYNMTRPTTIQINEINIAERKIRVTKDGQPYSVGSWKDTKEGASIQHAFAQEEEYQLFVDVRDKAGNYTSTSLTFVVDKTAPEIKAEMGNGEPLKDGSYINHLFQPVFVIDKPDEDNIVSVTLNGNGNVANRVPLASKEMNYQYRVVAQDKAKNETILNVSFTVDTTFPQLEIKGIVDGYFGQNMTPKITYSDTHLDEEKTAVTLNNGPFKSGQTLSREKDYVLKAAIYDLATNLSARSIVFTVDKSAPIIHFKEPVNLEYFNKNILPEFFVQDLSDYDIIALTLDGKDYTIGTPITEEGKHVLYMEVKDKAGNFKQVSIEFILDKTAPAILIEGVKRNKTYYNAVNMTIRLKSPQDRLKSVTLNGEPLQGTLIENDGLPMIKTTLSEKKEYTVEITAVDVAGNETNEIMTFEIADKPLLVKAWEQNPLMMTMGIVGIGIGFMRFRRIKRIKRIEVKKE